MITVQKYTSLITSQHYDKPKFVGTVEACVEPYVVLQNLLLGLISDFDLDTAVGAQLDVVGEWVGISRRLATPLLGVYFEWDGSEQVGWESGIWQGVFDPNSGITNLPDDSYRLLIKAKIASNNWDGTIPSAYRVWELLFTNSYIIIQDNQDMSFTIGIAGQPLGIVDQALLLYGYLPLKPAGVRVNYYLVSPSEGALFAWDVEPNSVLSGWDSGLWGKQLEQ